LNQLARISLLKTNLRVSVKIVPNFEKVHAVSIQRVVHMQG
jgi:hypothetical protein